MVKPLFIATPRSATSFMVRLLRTCGIESGHEDVFTRGGYQDNWTWVDAEVSGFAHVDPIRLDALKDQKPILHQNTPLSLNA